MRRNWDVQGHVLLSGHVLGPGRGMGRQSAIMIFNLAGFWGTGVPCGYVFTFLLHKGIVGLWYEHSCLRYVLHFSLFCTCLFL